MIQLVKLIQRRDYVVWLVEYNGTLKRVTVPRRAVKDSLLGMRHAICKATRLNAVQFRHVDNVRIKGYWVSRWVVVK
jgi:hypothetical protein